MQTVIETPAFIRQAEKVLSSEARAEVVDMLAKDPEIGVVIPGTGGIRKVRFAASGRGKRGGARVIYFYHDASIPLYALAIYAKNVADDMASDEKKVLTKLAETIKKAARKAK